MAVSDIEYTKFMEYLVEQVYLFVQNQSSKPEYCTCELTMSGKL